MFSKIVLSVISALLVSISLLGCGDKNRTTVSYPPTPPPVELNQLINYGSVTITHKHSVTLWIRNEIISYIPHPSVRLTKSKLRPGKYNTPLERALEEVVLTRPEHDPRVSPHVEGPPPGWTVVFITGRITLSLKDVMDKNQHGELVQTTKIDKEANGLTSFDQKVIWVWAKDDAVTDEDKPLAPAYAHELLHAHLYEEEIKLGRTHDEAVRTAISID